jgi:multidrug efflux system membrane fusion protein
MPAAVATPRARRLSIPSRYVVLALLLVTGLWACDRKKPAAGAPEPVEVTVIETKPRSAPLSVDGIGHVYAVRTVNVRSQVTGVVTQTLFAEGDVVKEGQPLLVIDPDAYKAKYDETVSTLARDRASAAQAKRDWLRYKDLVAQAVISQDDYEQKRTAYQQALEQVRVDEASVVNAKVNLDYCYINSPCAGVVGLQSYKTGNLVEANKDIIITVNQIEPINVQFAVAEKYLPDIRNWAAKGTLAVKASYPNHPDKVSTGKLTVINNTVDVNSGTITLQGEFPNTDHLLWPGQFVDAAVVLTDTADTILVPASAVVTTQDGSSLFIAKADNTVEVRKVEIGRKIGAETVVEKGVKAGEKVITSGQIKLFPGVPITIVSDQTYKEGPVSPAAVAERTKQSNNAGEGQGN